MWDGSEVGRIGLDEYAIIGNRANDVVACPVPERDDAAERDIPACIERSACEICAAGKTVQNTADAFPARLTDHRRGVVIRVTCVNDRRTVKTLCQLELHRECASLRVARRVVVMVVESTFAYGNCACIEQTLERRNICDGVERRRVVRVNSGRECDPARMRCRYPG